ncbi:MAG: YCF48-related protein [Daejeonella sp.]
MRSLVLIIFIVFAFKAASSQSIIPLQSGTNSSIRGLAVLDNSVAWLCGSNGYTAHTMDGGKTWQWKQVPGYEKYDFRDIEIFSKENIIIVNAGSPALILQTLDGGLTWKERYRNDSPDIFLDGMAFWDAKRGLIFGDPIDSKMQLLQTRNNGQEWQSITDKLDIPLIKDEASFAASGTTIRTQKGGKAWIATGGAQSRIFYTPDYGKTWAAYSCHIIQGGNTKGPFSIAFFDDKQGIAVGGDYSADTLRTNNLVLTNDSGKTWHKPVSTTFGYRSAVEYINQNVLIATGTSGTDISFDGGKVWSNISSDGYNTIGKSKDGKWILLAGSKGKISVVKLPLVKK